MQASIPSSLPSPSLPPSLPPPGYSDILGYFVTLVGNTGQPSTIHNTKDIVVKLDIVMASYLESKPPIINHSNTVSLGLDRCH